MAEYTGHSNKDYVCVDKDAEAIDSDTSSKDGALFHPVRNALCCMYHMLFVFLHE